MSRLILNFSILLIAVLLLPECTWGFIQSRTPNILQRVHHNQLSQSFSDDDNLQTVETSFTQKQLLRSEAESPFRKIRFFAYAGLSASAVISTIITLSSLLAVSLGRRSDLNMEELSSNLAVNLGGLAVMSVLFRRDKDAEISQLNRINQGGKIASLKVRTAGEKEGDPFVLQRLADFRINRGNAKNVLVVIGRREALVESIKSSLPVSRSLEANQLLLIGLAIDTSSLALSAIDRLPRDGNEPESESLQPWRHIGIPSSLPAWNDAFAQEIKTALKQNEFALEKGITLLIKQNGKIGKRKFGLPIFEERGDRVDAAPGEGFDVSSLFY